MAFVFPARRLRIISMAAFLIAPCSGTPALAQDGASPMALVPIANAPLSAPASTSGTFAAAMAAIRAGRWDAARAEIDAMRDAELAAFARSELYLAAGSPRVEGPALLALISRATDLPQAAQLERLATSRGITDLPALPTEQRLIWAGSSPRRGNPRAVDDASGGNLSRSIQDRISADDPAGAEALLTAAQARLSSDALTEYRYRVAWSYYIENDDANARRIAALAQGGTGAWLAQADWAQGLASWRSGDCRAAMAGFRNVAGRASEAELEASGHFWFARAATACGEPQEAAPAYARAAALNETFYGQLAVEVLGIRRPADRVTTPDVGRVAALRNVRAATALAAMGEAALADETLRHQARIGSASDHAALLTVAAQLNLPETQLYLAHNAPGGARQAVLARFPAPQWTPATGWRVNPALVFAHTLQESQFRARVVSPAGAVGLMQVRPGTAGDMGLASAGGRLTDPSVNLAMGQSYIEYLRDSGVTGGLLPKVIAAYNAGPTPVARWNSEIRDGGDPLLYIESIPYWETRGYVGTVLRNLWIYEQQLGTLSDTRATLAQGQWPRVPAAPAAANRMASTRSPSGGNR
ncbi:MAG: lytic transglycosylase domain-containing protein [Sphingopyxis sp.]